MRDTSSRNPGWVRAVSYAVALHAVVVALLVVGFRFTSKSMPVHGPLKAVMVREPLAEVAEKERAKQEQEKKQREQERQRVVEDERRKEAEQKKHEDAEHKKQEEAQRKKDEAERKKQTADAEKRKHDDERKKQDKQRQHEMEQALREQLADEEKSRAAARDARLASEADKYKAAIRQKVSRYWVRPASSRKELQCTVRVRLVPGGEVLEAKVVRTSGDANFDRSVEAAVHKASPLPLPENPELFERFREIEFVFRPEGESG